MPTTTACADIHCNNEFPVQSSKGYVECFLCSSAFHRQCAGKSGYEEGKRNLLWVCNVCFKNKAKFKTFIDSSIGLLKNEIKSDLASLETRLANLEASPIWDTPGLTPIRDEAVNVKSELHDAVNKLEMQNRQYNLVLYG